MSKILKGSVVYQNMTDTHRNPKPLTNPFLLLAGLASGRSISSPITCSSSVDTAGFWPISPPGFSDLVEVESNHLHRRGGSGNGNNSFLKERCFCDKFFPLRCLSGHVLLHRLCYQPVPAVVHPGAVPHCGWDRESSNASSLHPGV